MDSRQISVIQESFNSIPPNAKGKMTRVLYNRLFEIDPSLKKLFKKDIRDQRKKLLNKLNYIVANLHDAEIIGPKIKDLAKMHSSYGVYPKDYKVFEDALLFALSAALGDDFTPETKKAWKEMYEVLSKIMIDNSK